MNKVKRIIFVSILIISATATEVEAASVTGGAGSLTCGQFASMYAKSPIIEEAFYSWAIGFMSGYNLSTHTFYKVMKEKDINFPQIPDTDLSSMSDDAQKEFLRDFCSANPLKKYSLAVATLYGNLSPVHK